MKDDVVRPQHSAKQCNTLQHNTGRMKDDATRQWLRKNTLPLVEQIYGECPGEPKEE